MSFKNATARWSFCLLCLAASAGLISSAQAVPVGYTKTTIPLNATALGLAYAPNGTLYAIEKPASGVTATIRVFNPDLTESTPLSVTGIGASLSVGGMAFDPVDNALLITDNFGANAVYSVPVNGSAQSTLKSDASLLTVASVAVRPSGQIFLGVANGGGAGEVMTVDRGTGNLTTVMSGLDYTAGLAFDDNDDLIVQEAVNVLFTGRLTKLPITGVGPLSFGSPVALASGQQATYGLTIDSEGDYFTTGFGGLFEVSGGPLTETSFDTNGNPFQFSTTIAFSPGAGAFEPFAAGGGRLAFLSDAPFGSEDEFITLITPAASFLDSGAPEPASGVLMMMGMLLLSRARRKQH